MNPNVCKSGQLNGLVGAGMLVLLGNFNTVILPWAGAAARDPGASARIESSAGAVVVGCPAGRAPFSFQKAEGKLFYAGESAGNAAVSVLAIPRVGDPGVEAALGPVGFVLAPFAAGIGAIKDSGKKLSPAELTEVESNLVRAFELVADQRNLRDMLVRTARLRSRRTVFASDEKLHGSPAVFIETRIQTLALERNGKSDKDFRLRIIASARVMDVETGSMMLNQQYGYVSGKALFYDWTLQGSLTGTSETGYRDLAERMVNDVLSARSEQPILLGAGYSNRAKRANPIAIPAVLRLPRQPLPSAKAVIAPVAASDGSIGVFSSATISRFTMARPATWKEAVSDAPEETQALLGDLTDFPNSVVQITAFAAAIPISLWKQASGAVLGVSEQKRNKAQAALEKAACKVCPHDQLAKEIALRLAPLTRQRVMVVKQPLPPRAQEDAALMSALSSGTFSWLPVGHTPGSYLASQGNDTGLEIQVLAATLQGNEGVNPGLALFLEARATLFRTRDGQEIRSWPVSYRSQKHHFTTWASSDAKLFREELEKGSDQIGSAVVEQLVLSGALAPGVRTAPILAQLD